MAVQSMGLKAYADALNTFKEAEKKFANQAPNALAFSEAAPVGGSSFSETLSASLSKVNELQLDKSSMVTSFASGETQNVHELMISLQKASVAMKMTSAVRNKVLEAYKELSKIQF
ncbi:MAG: flagellar hook-basal body complex protein FliE [Desulfovibrionaceae bacterium]|nr:flagellar hook-basal body complex protein FliE [Desulfovibrionaceae bacterium]